MSCQFSLRTETDLYAYFEGQRVLCSNILHLGQGMTTESEVFCQFEAVGMDGKLYRCMVNMELLEDSRFTVKVDECDILL